MKDLFGHSVGRQYSGLITKEEGTRRCYIAGPITALQKRGATLEQVEEGFRASGDKVRAEFGYEPVIPFDLHPVGVVWQEALRADLGGLLTCHAIFYKTGWRESTGVKLERYVAIALDLVQIYESPNEKAQPSGSERFHHILDELGQLHDQKQRDYGTVTDPFANVRASTEFGIPAWQGAVLRGNDKMARIKAFIRNGRLENESLTDSLRDLAVYAIISLVLWEERCAADDHRATRE